MLLLLDETALFGMALGGVKGDRLGTPEGSDVGTEAGATLGRRQGRLENIQQGSFNQGYLGFGKYSMYLIGGATIIVATIFAAVGGCNINSCESCDYSGLKR